MRVTYTTTRVVVADSKLFDRTGDVGRWATGVAAGFQKNAVRYAPSGADSGRVNKSRANAHEPVGSLRRGISTDAHRVAVRHWEIVSESTASYTMYILKGTGAWIFSRSARIPAGEEGAGQFIPLGEGAGMYIPGNPGWGRSMWRQRVRGQNAQNFFEEAFAATARTHSSLRGFSMHI